MLAGNARFIISSASASLASQKGRCGPFLRRIVQSKRERPITIHSTAITRQDLVDGKICIIRGGRTPSRSEGIVTGVGDSTWHITRRRLRREPRLTAECV